VKGRILGVLLNRVDLRRDGYYYDYHRYYRSYYGGDDQGADPAKELPESPRI
jgi:hypothetical protein